MKISFVIPCLNEAKFIACQLESLFLQDYDGPFEIIVSDNGSTDNTKKIVDELSKSMPNLRLADASGRRGAAHARNIGAAAANGDVIFFVDADDVLPSNWLKIMNQAMENHDFITCRLNTEKLNEQWQQESWTNAQKDGPINFYPQFLSFAGSCAIGVKRNVHESVGGFDENIKCLEDADYCWRIQLAGTKLHFVSATEIYYRYPKKRKRMFKQMRMIGEYSVFLYKKYRPMGMPEIKWPVRTGIKRWQKFFKRLFKARNKMDVVKSYRQFAWLVGRFLGSVKYKVLAF